MSFRTFTGLIAAFGLVACAHAEGHGHDHPAEASADRPNKLVRDDAGAPVDNPFHPIKLLLSSEDSAGEVTIYEFLVPPNSPGSPPHTHTLEDEYFYILSGTLDVLSDEDVIRLGPGDFASLNRGHTHMFWNGSDIPVEFVLMTTGSSFEAFMQSVNPRLAEARPGSPEEIGAVIGALAAEHGIAITMEKMPEEAAPYYLPPQ